MQVEYKLLTSLNALNIVQSLIIFFGMAAGLSVCARVSFCVYLCFILCASLFVLPEVN